MMPIVRMIAEAAQKYGIIVRDQSPQVTFYGEDTNDEGLTSSPWGPIFQGQYPNNFLKQFPWSDLQALKDNITVGWHN